MTVHCLFIAALGNGRFVQKDHLATVGFVGSKAWKMGRQRPRFPSKPAAFRALLDPRKGLAPAAFPPDLKCSISFLLASD